MKLLNRRTVITFEKLERRAYHFGATDSIPLLARCEQCDRDVTWLTPTQVAAVSGWSLREVFKRIEAKTVHYREVSPELLDICFESLSHGEKSKPAAPQLALLHRPEK
jgi:hypothetical protein